MFWERWKPSSNPIILSISTLHMSSNLMILTLFQAGMGQFDHGTIYLSIVSTKVGLGSPKLVTLFLSLFDLSQKSHFWNVFFKFFWKLNIKIFRGPQAWRKKLNFWNFFEIFFRNSHFFLLNHYCTCSKLSFEVYNSFPAQNLKFWCFLLEKFQFWP